MVSNHDEDLTCQQQRLAREPSFDSFLSISDLVNAY